MPEARELERLRWRCRRGMLEVDLLLARFVERHLASLDADGRRALDTLLLYPDNELIEFLMERKPCPDAGLHSVLDLIRRS